MGYCQDSNCGYYWKAEGEYYPHCHFEGPDGTAPCEVEDNEDEY